MDRGTLDVVVGIVLVIGGCSDGVELRSGACDTTWETVIPVWDTGPWRLDLVFLIDNSASMALAQEVLAGRLPAFITELVDPPDTDGDGRPDHPAIEDLNVGFISPDMGTMGIPAETCGRPEAGDDGCFLHRADPAASGCAEDYPRFLHRCGTSHAPDQLVADAGCIARLGTNGCGFEQPLKAMLKAVRENTRPGGCNEGFIRDDSILALYFVSDENDGSVDPAHPEMFDPARTDLGSPNLRVFLNPELLVPVSDYVSAFRELRPPDRQRDLVLGMIVGVPPDASSCIGSGDQLTGCLDQPAMQEQIDPAWAVHLVPSCNTTTALAFPPRRFVELAQAFGSNAYVDSICKSDWSEAWRAVTDRLVERLDPGCYPRLLPFDDIDDGDPDPPELCTTDCYLIRRIPADTTCLYDDSCPQAWCPPATLDDVLCRTARSCANPDTGETCRPLERDLGRTTSPDGTIAERLCLVRQARRPFDPVAGRCGEPAEIGWSYSPAGYDTWDPGCPDLDVPREAFACEEGGREFELHCPSLVCPPSQQCGTADYPTFYCCAEGEVCERGLPDEFGRCRAVSGDVPAG